MPGVDLTRRQHVSRIVPAARWIDPVWSPGFYRRSLFPFPDCSWIAPSRKRSVRESLANAIIRFAACLGRHLQCGGPLIHGGGPRSACCS